MGKALLLKSEIDKIKKLRETGHSLNEIKSVVNRGYGTVYRYMKNVPVISKYQDILKSKQGGSSARSQKNWNNARKNASKIINDLNFKEKMVALSCLYWGEGNKTELSLINSDPSLLKVFLSCLRELGIKESDLKISLRLFEDIDRNKATDFWLKILHLPNGSITKYDIKKGSKSGKLKYGMCRIRVKKSDKYFKLIMSMIDLIKLKV